MSKALLYRWFGLGKLPVQVRAVLEKEGIVLFDEGIRGSVTMRNFRSPTRRSSWRRVGFVGSVVLTRRRLALFALSKPVINVPLDHQRFDALEISLPREDKLCIRFEAADFHDDRSGTLECRVRTPQARAFVEHLQETDAP